MPKAFVYSGTPSNKTFLLISSLGKFLLTMSEVCIKKQSVLISGEPHAKDILESKSIHKQNFFKFRSLHQLTSLPLKILDPDKKSLGGSGAYIKQALFDHRNLYKTMSFGPRRLHKTKLLS